MAPRRLLCVVLLVLAASGSSLGGEILRYTEPQHSRTEQGDPGNNVTGGWSWVDRSGERHHIWYVADNRGFRAYGDLVPDAPPSPSLKIGVPVIIGRPVIAKNQQKSDSGGVPVLLSGLGTLAKGDPVVRPDEGLTRNVGFTSPVVSQSFSRESADGKGTETRDHGLGPGFDAPPAASLSATPGSNSDQMADANGSLETPSTSSLLSASVPLALPRLAPPPSSSDKQLDFEGQNSLSPLGNQGKTISDSSRSPIKSTPSQIPSPQEARRGDSFPSQQHQQQLNDKTILRKLSPAVPTDSRNENSIFNGATQNSNSGLAGSQSFNPSNSRDSIARDTSLPLFGSDIVIIDRLQVPNSRKPRIGSQQIVPKPVKVKGQSPPVIMGLHTSGRPPIRVRPQRPTLEPLGIHLLNLVPFRGNSKSISSNGPVPRPIRVTGTPNLDNFFRPVQLARTTPSPFRLPSPTRDYDYNYYDYYDYTDYEGEPLPGGPHRTEKTSASNLSGKTALKEGSEETENSEEPESQDSEETED